MQKNFFIYSTRIEVTPYEKGDLDELERMCSYYDPVTHRRVPIGYCITDNKIIIPRGISLMKLQKLTGNIPTFQMNTNKYAKMKYEYHIKEKPRDEGQEKTIQFLTCQGEFQKYEKYTQFALNLETGFGKTYCTIHSLVKLKQRCLIIVHQLKIKEQWIKEIHQITDIPDDRIYNISGSKSILDIIDGDNDYDVFLINQQTITSFASTYGWDKVTEFFDKLEIGVKVIDEAHQYFKNILLIDFFTNVPKNFYLTATFNRSDEKEVPIFKRAFANTIRFGENIHRRKHVIYTFVFYNSKPSNRDQISIRTQRGVSSYLFNDYAFKKDPYHTMEYAIYQILNQVIKIEGRIVIVIPKIETIQELEKEVKKRYQSFSVGTIISKNTDVENERVKKECDIILTTIKGIGTGSDIHKLRHLIIIEPHSSSVTSDQLIGRLREYSSTDDTYVYELIDSGFPAIMRMVNRRFKTIQNKCKKINQLRL